MQQQQKLSDYMLAGERSGNTYRKDLRRWKRAGRVSRIRRDVYLPKDIENRFCIACNAVQDGILCYHGALDYYLLQTQVFNVLYVHAPKRFRNFTHEYAQYEYKPLKFVRKPLVVEFDKDYKIKVTSYNQTIIDCLFNINLAGGLEELTYALIEADATLVDEEELLACLKLYDNKSLYQRAGFMLSLFKDKFGLSDTFFDFCKNRIGKNVSYLTFPFYCKKYDSVWRLYVPKDIYNSIKGYDEYL